MRVRDVLDGFGEPRYSAVSPAGRHAFVSDSLAGELVVLDLARAVVVARLELGGPARHVSLDRSGHTLWVALGSKAERIAIVDVSVIRRPRVTARLRPPFLAHDVGLAPSGGRAWVTSGDRREIAIYDTRRAELLTRVAAHAPPQHVSFARRLAFVTSGDDGSLRVHDEAGRLIASSRVPVGSYNVQSRLDRVVSPSLTAGTLAIADTRGTVLRRIRVASSCHDACVVAGAQ